MSYFSPKNGLFEGVIRDMSNNGLLNTIELKSSGTYSKNTNLPFNAIDFNFSSYYLSNDNSSSGQWISFGLKDRYVSLTHYSLLSRTGNHMKNWELSTSNDEIEWTVVHSMIDNNILNTDKGKLFRTKKVVARYFKITNNAPTAGIYDTRFRVTAFDIFGSVIPCGSSCTNVPTFVSMPKLCNTMKYTHNILLAQSFLVLMLVS